MHLIHKQTGKDTGFANYFCKKPRLTPVLVKFTDVISQKHCMNFLPCSLLNDNSLILASTLVSLSKSINGKLSAKQGSFHHRKESLWLNPP